MTLIDYKSLSFKAKFDSLSKEADRNVEKQILAIKESRCTLEIRLEEAKNKEVEQATELVNKIDKLQDFLVSMSGVEFLPFFKHISTKLKILFHNQDSVFHNFSLSNFWSLDLLEAIQGITFQLKTSSCHLLNFSVFHHVFISSLDMFKNCINSYHIHDSEQV